LGARKSADPDGVIATLEIARRLISENPELTVEGALLEAADKFASPKDPAKAFWTAYHAFSAADTSDAQEALKLAADHQGQVNQLVKKGPR
jgi:hypothetical protein